MKTIVALLALSFSATASAAMCYQIFSSSNVLVWQGNRPPVQLDHPAIDDEVEKMVQGGHLIIIDDHSAPCQPINTIPEKTSPRVVKRSGTGG